MTEVKAIEIPRYEGEAQAMEGNAAAEDNPYASGGAAAVLSGGGAVLKFSHIQVPHSGTYTVLAAVMNASPDAELELSVNGGAKTLYSPSRRNAICLPFGSWS